MKKRIPKPIKVFYNELTGTFWASQHYTVKGKFITITGKKYDVTSDIGAAVTKHDLEFKPCSS